MSGHVKDGGSWREISQPSVKDGDAWRTVTAGHVKDGGSWRQWYEQSTGLAVPAGAMMLYAGDSAPTNWAICDGSSYNTSTYSQLNTNINGTYGSNLPNLSGHYLKHNATPSIQSGAVLVQHYHGSVYGASGSSECRPGADPGSNAGSSGNAGSLSNSGNSTGFKQRTLLPIIALIDCNLPAGCVVLSCNTDAYYSGTRTELLQCHGGTASASTYADLYSIVGTSYGGDATNFGLPDLRGVFLQAVSGFSKPGGYTADSYQSHYHGPFYYANGGGIQSRYSDSAGRGGCGSNTTSANSSSVGSGDTNETRPPNIAFHALITTVEIGIAGGELIFFMGTGTDIDVGSTTFYSMTGQTFTGSDQIISSCEAGFKSSTTFQAVNIADDYIRVTDRGAGTDPNAANRAHASTYSSGTGANLSGTDQATSLTSHSHSFNAPVCNGGPQYWGTHNQQSNCQTPSTNFNTLGATANSGNVSTTMQQTHALVNVMVCKG